MKKLSSASLARELRNKETETEQIIWSWLRAKQQDGFKFRRQELIGNYIVDFVCYNKRLIIEIDGGQHNEANNLEKDELRTKWLESQRFHVVRFWNNEVAENLDGVMVKILEALK